MKSIIEININKLLSYLLLSMSLFIYEMKSVVAQPCLPVTFDLPATISCSDDDIALGPNQVFSSIIDAITPCYYLEVSTGPFHTLSVDYLSNGTSIGVLNFAPNGFWQGRYYTASPSAVNQVNLCESGFSTLGPPLPYVIKDCNSGITLASGTWVMDGNCELVDVTPPGALIGKATWTSNSTGLIDVLDNGTATFSPASAGPGTWDITYCWNDELGCDNCQTKSITVTSNFNAAWTNPGAICSSDGTSNFNALVTGNAGGTWSGDGISPTGTFNPSGLNGTIPITYTVGTGSCAATSTIEIVVIDQPDASWDNSTSVCLGETVSLNPLITGTTGGTWSGQGVSGTNFNTTGLSGNIPITYTVGSASCQATSTLNISIINQPDAGWTPPVSVCEGQTTSLNPLITGTTGGSWSGSGVSGSSFNSSGLLGNILITYTVSVNSCNATSTQNILVIEQAIATWNPPSGICQGQTVSLNPLITGTSGGTWSGQGVSGNNFNTAGLNGDIAITYTVGTIPCQVTSTQNINVALTASASWTGPASICDNAGVTDFNSYVSGTGGGTWSGSGISASGSFNPISLSGNVTISYAVGSGTCAASFDAVINVIITPPIPSVSGETEFCDNDVFTPLTASGTGSNFQWYNNANLNNPIATGTSFTPSSSMGTSYWLTQSNGSCVSQPLVINLTINPSPEPPTIPSQYTYCESTGFPELTVSGASGTINWYSEAQLDNLIHTGTSFQPTDATLFNFWITQTTGGCTSNPATTSLIAQNQVTANISPQGPVTICSGDSITLRSNSPTNNVWSTGATSPSIVVSTAGTISLTVNGECNIATDQITVIEESVEASFEIDKTSGFAPLTVNFNNTSSNSNSSCVWLMNNIPNNQLSSGNFTFDSQGTYALTLLCTTPGGCEDRMTKVISVGAAEVELYVPNAFTPNGDDVNSVFKVYGIGITYINVQIYNRWGELIYQWKDMEDGWDGTVGNRLAPQDVYTYIIYGVDSNGERIKRLGYFTLIGE